MLAAIFLKDKLKEEKMVPKWSNNNSRKITQLRNIFIWIANQEARQKYKKKCERLQTREEEKQLQQKDKT